MVQIQILSGLYAIVLHRSLNYNTQSIFQCSKLRGSWWDSTTKQNCYNKNNFNFVLGREISFDSIVIYILHGSLPYTVVLTSPLLQWGVALESRARLVTAAPAGFEPWMAHNKKSPKESTLTLHKACDYQTKVYTYTKKKRRRIWEE